MVVLSLQGDCTIHLTLVIFNLSAGCYPTPYPGVQSAWLVCRAHDWCAECTTGVQSSWLVCREAARAVCLTGVQSAWLLCREAARSVRMTGVQSGCTSCEQECGCPHGKVLAPNSALLIQAQETLSVRSCAAAAPYLASVPYKHPPARGHRQPGIGLSQVLTQHAAYHTTSTEYKDNCVYFLSSASQPR